MYRKIKNAKGVSLAEMCVVLSVISIVALTVVSFTAMVSNRTMVSAAKLNAMEDLELTQTIMEGWIEQMEPHMIQMDGNRESLATTVEGTDYTLFLENKTLHAKFLGGDAVRIQLKVVEALRFEIEGTADALYFCTIVYKLPTGKKSFVEATYTFCVNTRVGETIPTSGSAQ